MEVWQVRRGRQRSSDKESGYLQALVAKAKEPITPFLSKIKALADLRVSCVLVIGGSGDYFSVADTVLCMEDFACRDVSAEAHSIAQQFEDNPAVQETPPYGPITARVPLFIHPSSGDGELFFYALCLALPLSWQLQATPQQDANFDACSGNACQYAWSSGGEAGRDLSRHE